MIKNHKLFQRILSIILSAFLIFTLVMSVDFSSVFADTSVNGWTIQSPADNINLKADGNKTQISFSSGYNWETKESALLLNKLYPSNTATVAFTFKADLKGDEDAWLPMGLCWNTDNVGVLSANTFSINVKGNNSLEILRRQDVLKTIENFDVTKEHLVEVSSIGDGNKVSLKIDNEEVYILDDVDFHGMISAINFNLGLTLAVGGGANCSVVIDTNASGWIANGSQKSNVKIWGSPTSANIRFDSGDHSTVYASTVPNTFKNLKTGVWGFDLNVNSMATSWAGITLNWSIDGVSPAVTSSGIYFAIEADTRNDDDATSLKTYKITPKQMKGAAQDIEGAKTTIVNAGQDVRVIIESSSGGDIVIKINGNKVVSYTDTSMNSLGFDFPYAGNPGLTLSTCGGGAYSAIIKTFDLDVDKASLKTVLEKATLLSENTTVGTEAGNVSSENFDAFKAVLDIAQNAFDDDFVTQAAVNKAALDLEKATLKFQRDIIKTNDAGPLYDVIDDSNELLSKLGKDSENYNKLKTKIEASIKIANDPFSTQAQLDNTKAELAALTNEIEESGRFWTTDPETLPEGVAITTDGEKTTFTTTQGMSGSVDAYNTVIMQDNGSLIFDINLEKSQNPSDIWQALSVAPTSQLNQPMLERVGLRITFGGSYGNGEIFAVKDNSETGAIKIGKFSFRDGYNIQFKLAIEKRNETDTLVVRIDGLEFATTNEAAVLNAFKEELALGYTIGNNEGKEAIAVIDLDPQTIKKDVDFGTFIPTGPSGTGQADGSYVTIDDELQTLNFLMDKGVFSNTMLRTNIEGLSKNDNTLEFSFKINSHSPYDWHIISFTDNITWTGINTPALTISFAGSDMSVQFAEFGKNGSENIAWRKDTITKQDKKMRLKFDLDGDEIICYMNDKEVNRTTASDKVKAIFASPMLEVGFFGSADLDSEFEISYINKDDPVPFDSLEDPLPEGTSEIISLDEEYVTVEDKVITLLKPMNLEKLNSLLYVDDGFSLAYFDVNGKQITDFSTNAIYVKTVSVMSGDKETDVYTVINMTGEEANYGPNADGQSGTDKNTNTGIRSYTNIALIIIFVSVLALTANTIVRKKLDKTNKKS